MVFVGRVNWPDVTGEWESDEFVEHGQILTVLELEDGRYKSLRINIDFGEYDG